jgi:hypothetical protein
MTIPASIILQDFPQDLIPNADRMFGAQAPSVVIDCLRSFSALTPHTTSSKTLSAAAH